MNLFKSLVDPLAEEKVVRERRDAVRQALTQVVALAAAHKDPITNPKGCICALCAAADKLKYAEVTVNRTDLFTSDTQLVEYQNWHKTVQSVFTDAGLEILDVVESENRYCGDRCCPHRPAVTVTTNIGNIDFWLRKRVSVIDWSPIEDTKTAKELFPTSTDTMGDRMIHCWDYATVIARLKAVLASFT